MPAEKPAKPAWTRCPKCGDRLFNDPIDIEKHSHHCPADLLRELRRLTGRVEELEKRPVAVATPAPTVLEPALDFEGIAPWSGDVASEEEEPVEAGIFEEVLHAVPAAVAPAIDDYGDEDDDEEIVTISRPVMQ